MGCADDPVFGYDASGAFGDWQRVEVEDGQKVVAVVEGNLAACVYT